MGEGQSLAVIFFDIEWEIIVEKLNLLHFAGNTGEEGEVSQMLLRQKCEDSIKTLTPIGTQRDFGPMFPFS